MSSNFFSSTMAQVGAVAQAAQHATQTEVRVGSRTVQINRRLAEGGFGVVELVTDIYTKQEMVLKRCNIDRPESFDIANTEIKMLQKFKGPYVVNLLDSCIFQKTKTTREAFLLMEYYPGDHLLNRLLQRNGAYLPQDSIYRMFGQLCLGVKDMHLSRPAIVHRDLKLENVLFGQDGKVRMCDFGSCVESPIYIRNVDERTAADEHIQKETTQMYRAPEMVDLYLRPTLTEKTDIWALGCMLFAMCFLIHPFMDGSSLGILNAKVNFPADSPFPADLHALILRLLDIDPECRPTIVELIDWVTAIAHGKPLPAQNLSAEAEQCRATRIASNQLRESKANSKLKAKQAAKPAPKQPVALSANSVAARRLATMRGQPLPEENYKPAAYLSSPAHGAPQSQHQHHSPGSAEDDSFDPFAQKSGGVTASPVFEASFEDAPTPSFATFEQSSAGDSFDPFGNAPTAAFPSPVKPPPKPVKRPSGTAAVAPAAPPAAPTAPPAPAARAASNDGFASFSATTEAWGEPSFSATPAAGGFDAFATTESAAFVDDGFTPTGVAPSGGYSSSAKFDNDAPFDAQPSSFDDFAATSDAVADDGFSPRSAAGGNGGDFNPFDDSDYSAPASTKYVADSFFDASDVITPTASSTAGTGNFFATEDFDTPPPVAPAPVVVPRRQSAASQLFASYQDDEPATPKTPATPQAAQYDPWATTAQVAPLVPAAVAPPAPAPAPALIDIFGDDLLLPAAGQNQNRTAPTSAAPTPSGKPRNALDLLSLYDQPLTPAPKNAMMGSSPGMGNGLTMGMSPMSMGAPSPMGFRQAGVPMQPMQPMQSMQMGMQQQGGMGGGGMGGGGMGGPMGGRAPMMSPQGGSTSMYGGNGPVPSGSGKMAGRPPQYSTTPARAPQAPADPFDSINMLKR